MLILSEPGQEPGRHVINPRKSYVTLVHNHTPPVGCSFTCRSIFKSLVTRRLLTFYSLQLMMAPKVRWPNQPTLNHSPNVRNLHPRQSCSSPPPFGFKICLNWSLTLHNPYIVICHNMHSNSRSFCSVERGYIYNTGTPSIRLRSLSFEYIEFVYTHTLSNHLKYYKWTNSCAQMSYITPLVRK